jgi:site-specific recombinase XerD
VIFQAWESSKTMPPVKRGTPSQQTPHERQSSQPTRIQDPLVVLKKYVLWHESEGHSRKTEAVYELTLKPFFKYLREEHQVEDLTQIDLNHLRAWLVWLRNTPSQRNMPRSSKTIESYCRQVMAFLRWCMEEEIITHNPIERLKLPRAEKKQLRVFTDDEIKRMHEVCQPPSAGLRPDVRRMLTARNRAILRVLLNSGMRASELIGMRFMDFDRKRGTIYIMGKGAKERKVLLGQRGYHYLCGYLDYWRGEPESQEERLILSDDGSHLTPNGIALFFRRLKKASGITDKRASAHSCRHWYAIRFLLKGGKLFALQKHLGHETLEMVRIYANVTEQDSEEEKRKYSPADDVELEPAKVKRRGFRKG